MTTLGTGRCIRSGKESDHFTLFRIGPLTSGQMQASTEKTAQARERNANQQKARWSALLLGAMAKRTAATRPMQTMVTVPPTDVPSSATLRAIVVRKGNLWSCSREW